MVVIEIRARIELFNVWKAWSNMIKGRALVCDNQALELV